MTLLYIACHDFTVESVSKCPIHAEIMESSAYQPSRDLIQAAIAKVSRISVIYPAMSVSSVLVSMAIAAIVVRALFQAYRTPLRDIPGPWLAKFTRLWLLRAYASRSFQKTNLDLHRKLGLMIS